MNWFTVMPEFFHRVSTQAYTQDPILILDGGCNHLVCMVFWKIMQSPHWWWVIFRNIRWMKGLRHTPHVNVGFWVIPWKNIDPRLREDDEISVSQFLNRYIIHATISNLISAVSFPLYKVTTSMLFEILHDAFYAYSELASNYSKHIQWSIVPNSYE